MSKKKNRKKPSGKQAETPCNVTLENRLTEYFALDQFRKSTQGGFVCLGRVPKANRIYLLANRKLFRCRLLSRNSRGSCRRPL